MLSSDRTSEHVVAKTTRPRDWFPGFRSNGSADRQDVLVLHSWSTVDVKVKRTRTGLDNGRKLPQPDTSVRPNDQTIPDRRIITCQTVLEGRSSLSRFLLRKLRSWKAAMYERIYLVIRVVEKISESFGIRLVERLRIRENVCPSLPTGTAQRFM